jgi:hypothetical protein
MNFYSLPTLFCFVLILFSTSFTQSLEKPTIDDFDNFHNTGNLGLSVTNFGLFGQGYNIEEQPSCQYKYHSGLEKEKIEHFSWAGLWFGGIGGVNGQYANLVSTGIVDGVFPGGETGLEFTNSDLLDDIIKERSSIVTSPLFDPMAISHQDFICDFTDQNTVVPGTQITIINHDPLGINVHLETYAWNYSYADAFVILNYTFTNISNYPIDSIYVGLWVDASVANMNYTSIYEPGGGFSWYDNLNGFDSEYNMGYQFDVDGDQGFAESYLGIRALGSSIPGERYQSYYDQWQWNNANDPEFFMPIDDEGRFDKLSTTPTAPTPSSPADMASWMLLLSMGSLGNLEPGDSLNAVFAVVCGFWANTGPDSPQRRKNLRTNSDWAQIAYNGEDVDGDGKLDPDEDLNGNGLLDPGEDDYNPGLDLNFNGRWDLGEGIFGDNDGHLDVFEDTFSNFQKGIQDSNGVINRYILPSPPPSPNLLIVPGDRKVTLYWDDLPEHFEDPITREKDFEGYRIYSSPKTLGSTDEASLLAQFDIIDSVGLGYETGFGAVKFDTTIDGKSYSYRFINDNMLNGWPGQYFFAVTSFDKGNPTNNLPSMESSIYENQIYAIPGKQASMEENRKIYVYPNPYKAGALWDGFGSRDRLIWFANLPDKSTIRIYSLAGDLIDEIDHDAQTYSGSDISLLAQRTISQNTKYSGGEHAWDLISKNDQAIATGMYLYTVKDEDTGKLYTGKFLVIK